jgi:hypothetical protein
MTQEFCSRVGRRNEGCTLLIVSECQVEWSVSGLGGYAYCVAVSPSPPHQLAVACGDSSIRMLPLDGWESGCHGSVLLWRVRLFGTWHEVGW